METDGYPEHAFLVLEVGPHLLLTVEYWCGSCAAAPTESQAKVAERVRVATGHVVDRHPLEVLALRPHVELRRSV